MRYVLFALVVAAILMPAAVSAASAFTMGLSRDSVSVCPCSTVNDVAIRVTNTGDATDSFKLSMELPQGFTGFIYPEPMVLGVGESTDVDAFWVTPSCSIEPGIYQVKVTMKDSAGRTAGQSILSIEVLSCHKVEISSDLQADSCAGKDFPVDIQVTNFGKQKEPFSLAVDASWGKNIFTGKMDLASEESGVLQIKATAPEKAGTYYLTISAKSDSSYASDERIVQLNVKNCFDFTARMEPTEATACTGGFSQHTIFIDNLGSLGDSYSLSGPSWVNFEKDTIQVSPGSQGKVNVIVEPRGVGVNDFEVGIVSENLPAKKAVLKGRLTSQECRDVAVVVSPADRDACQGTAVDYQVLIKNTGSVEDSFNIASTLGKLSINKIVLSPGQSGEARLTVDTKQFEVGSVQELTVTAGSEGAKDTNSVKLKVKNCYSAEMTVEPAERGLCTGDQMPFQVTMKNTGEYADNYVLEFENQTFDIPLGPGEGRVMGANLLGDYEPGTNTAVFRLVSKNAEVTKQVSVIMKDPEKCYGIKVFPVSMTDTSAEVGVGKVVVVRVENTGERLDNYQVQLEGPEWAYFSPAELMIPAGESRDVYIYMSPSYEASAGNYAMKLFVSSPRVSRDVGFNATLDGANMSGGNFTLNVSGLGFPVTGAFAGVSVDARLVLLGVIVVLIIAILFVKLILFVK